ncbi:MAG: FAD-dependent oxidoreductase [Sciscionella sp.]
MAHNIINASAIPRGAAAVRGRPALPGNGPVLGGGASRRVDGALLPASPATPGSAIYGLWQAFYHQVEQWHAVGGAQGLIDVLTRRLESYGGRWRTGAVVARILRNGERVTGAELGSGKHIDATCVITAIDPAIALLDLLNRPLSETAASALCGVHRGNAVQMLVLPATTALSAYPGTQRGDWNGLQSYVDTPAALADGFAAAEARRLPDDPVPSNAFTPSALDDSLAPPACHTVYLAPVPVTRRMADRPRAVCRADDRHRRGAGARVAREHRRPGYPYTGGYGTRTALARSTPDAPRYQPRPARSAASHPGAVRAWHADGTPMVGLFVTGAGHRARGGYSGVSPAAPPHARP